MLFKVILGAWCSAVLFCWFPSALGSPTPTPAAFIHPSNQSSRPDSRKVAVLIAGEYARSSDLKSNSGFWYDTVMMYCMLRENGYADEDIYVLYGHGQDGFYYPADPTPTPTGSTPTPKPTPTGSATPPPTRYYEPPYCHNSLPASGEWRKITDFPMVYSLNTDLKNGRCRPQDLFECLERGCFLKGSRLNRFHGVSIEPLDENDFLFVWWRGHGSVGSDPGTFTMSLPAGSFVFGTDVVEWVQAIPAGSRLLVFETCCSGCLTKIVEDKYPPTVLLTSTGCDELSDVSYEPDVLHAVWSYWIAGTLSGFLPNGASTTIEDEEAGTEHTVRLGRGGPSRSRIPNPAQRPYSSSRINTRKSTMTWVWQRR